MLVTVKIHGDIGMLRDGISEMIYFCGVNEEKLYALLPFAMHFKGVCVLCCWKGGIALVK